MGHRTKGHCVTIFIRLTRTGLMNNQVLGAINLDTSSSNSQNQVPPTLSPRLHFARGPICLHNCSLSCPPLQLLKSIPSCPYGLFIIYSLSPNQIRDTRTVSMERGTCSYTPFSPKRAIIPQALIREAITEADDIDEDLGNISITSTGAVCHSRDKGTHSSQPLSVRWLI